MLGMVGCNHRGQPIHLRSDRPARHQHIAYREDALPRRRDCGGHVRSKDTHPNGDIAYTQTGETGFLQKAADPVPVTATWPRSISSLATPTSASAVRRPGPA